MTTWLVCIERASPSERIRVEHVLMKLELGTASREEALSEREVILAVPCMLKQTRAKSQTNRRLLTDLGTVLYCRTELLFQIETPGPRPRHTYSC